MNAIFSTLPKTPLRHMLLGLFFCVNIHISIVGALASPNNPLPNNPLPNNSLPANSLTDNLPIIAPPSPQMMHNSSNENKLNAQSSSPQNNNSQAEDEKNIDALKSIYDDEELLELTKPNEAIQIISEPEKDIDEAPAPDMPAPNTEDAPTPPATNEPILAPAIIDAPQAKSPEKTLINTPAKSPTKAPIEPATEKAIKQPSPQSAINDAPKLMRGKRQFEPSFTNKTYSMFFNEAELAKYLNIIRKVEQEVFLNGGLSADILNSENINIDEALLEDELIAEEAEPEPIIFPYFHLISVLYHTPKHWAVMANGITLTTEKNDPTNELYVRSITPNMVQLAWKPQDYRLFDAVNNNHKSPEQYENKSHYQSIKHRNIKGISNVSFNDELGVIYFTLQPNQLFFTEYARIYEGNPKNILPPPPPLETPATDEVGLDGTSIPNDILAEPAGKTPPTQDLPNFEENTKTLKENVDKL